MSVRAGMLLVAFVGACATKYPCVAPNLRNAQSEPNPGTIGQSPPRAELGAHVFASMACGLDPCVDFYHYACGGYLDARASGSGRQFQPGGFGEIHARHRQLLHGILEVTADTMDQSHERAVLGSFYRACEAQEKRGAPGVRALAPVLAKIDAIEDHADAMRVLASLHELGVGAFFGIGVMDDPRFARYGLLFAGQHASALPIEHLRGDTTESAALVDAYREYALRLLRASGVPPLPARASADAAMGLERALAKVSLTATERERSRSAPEITKLAELAAAQPDVPWAAYREGLGIPAEVELAYHRDYLARAAAILVAADIADVRAYLRWRTLSAFAQDGSTATRDAQWWFEAEVLREVNPHLVVSQWAYCVDRAEHYLPELLGQYFVQLELPQASRVVARQIANEVRAGFRERIAANEWLDTRTRDGALRKLDGIVMQVGSPARWLDYGAVSLRVDDHLANALQLAQLEFDRALYRVGRTRDADDWAIAAHDVNAVYETLLNTVTIPAGILQWPLFRPDLPRAMDYGGLGSVIGHELGHAFDTDSIDHGADGLVKPWITEFAAREYEARAQCLVDDLDRRVGDQGTQTNGALVLDEAIADAAGLAAAHTAWRRWRADHKEVSAIDGLTDEQLFFIAFAQARCDPDTEAFERVAAITDTHADAAVRVNATLAQVPAFAQAFACAEDTPLHPTKTCDAW